MLGKGRNLHAFVSIGTEKADAAPATQTRKEDAEEEGGGVRRTYKRRRLKSGRCSLDKCFLLSREKIVESGPEARGVPVSPGDPRAKKNGCTRLRPCTPRGAPCDRAGAVITDVTIRPHPLYQCTAVRKSPRVAVCRRYRDAMFNSRQLKQSLVTR